MSTVDGWQFLIQQDLWRAYIFTLPRLRRDANRFVGERYQQAIDGANEFERRIFAELESRLAGNEPQPLISDEERIPPKDKVKLVKD